MTKHYNTARLLQARAAGQRQAMNVTCLKSCEPVQNTMVTTPTTPAAGDQLLAIFDLDNTLLGGDSDHAWGEFLIAKGLVDADTHQRENDRFYQDYCAGELDIDAYLRFALKAIAGLSREEVGQLHQVFMREVIAPMRLAKAEALLEEHRSQGHFLLVITATADVISAPIAFALGVDDVLASNAAVVDDTYTGEPTGTPCFQQGKVLRLQRWLADRHYSLDEAFFYSDSHNDLPLLEAVGQPVAVDADDKLREQANQRGWPCISLR